MIFFTYYYKNPIITYMKRVFLKHTIIISELTLI